MSKLTAFIDQALYPQYNRNWDDELFRMRIMSHLRPSSRVLDLGAGSGIVEQMNFRGLAAEVCGVDLDPRVLDNPMLDEGRVSNADKIPYESEYFDVVFADNVLEHLNDPLQVFREVARVMKKGGYFLFKTPNKWHYVPTLARLTPHGFHQYFNRMRGRAEVDTFPTLYRANSFDEIFRLAEGSGLSVEKLERIEGRPEYLRISPLTYAIGAAYERLVNATPMLERFRILLIGTLRKPPSNPAA